jgi:hypothetical protein
MFPRPWQFCDLIVICCVWRFDGSGKFVDCVVVELVELTERNDTLTTFSIASMHVFNYSGPEFDIEHLLDR